MTKRFRALLVAGTVAGALATAGTAWASYAPKLMVASPSAATPPQTTITVSAAQTDDPTAKTQIYVPTGYTIDTSAAPGTKLGTVTAKASAADLGNTVLTLDGELDAIPANQPGQAQCGVTTAAATWDLHLNSPGGALDIPMYVVQTAGPEATVASFKLVVCLPPPDVPVGTPGRAVFGAKLLSATFSSSAITPPTTVGEFKWTSLWTPYTPGTGKPNAAGTVETQSLVRIPSLVQITGVKTKRIVHTRTVKVHGKKVRRRTVTTGVTYAAKVTEGGDALAGAKVTFRISGRPAVVKVTDATGVVGGSFVLAKGAATIAVTAVIPARDLGAAGCVATAAFGGLPCIDANVGGSTHTATTRVTAFRK